MKIVILEPLGVSSAELQELAQSYLSSDDELKIAEESLESVSAMTEFAADAEAVVIANGELPAELIEALPKLRFVGVAFTGVDHVDLEACQARDIVVSNCAGYATSSVADLTFGLTIGLLREMKQADQVTREQGTKEGLRQTELAGLTFGIIGMGAIGRKVAEIARAFDCNVIAYNRSAFELEGVKQVDLDTILRESNVVSLHVPLTNETQGMIGAGELAKMRPDALLINTARGPVVDSQALADSLAEGKIRGAGLDVFDKEPPIASDDPLLTAPNTLLAPHIGFASEQALVKRAKMTFANLDAWRSGEPQNVVS